MGGQHYTHLIYWTLSFYKYFIDFIVIPINHSRRVGKRRWALQLVKKTAGKWNDGGKQSLVAGYRNKVKWKLWNRGQCSVWGGRGVCLEDSARQEREVNSIRTGALAALSHHLSPSKYLLPFHPLCLCPCQLSLTCSHAQIEMQLQEHIPPLRLFIRLFQPYNSKNDF